MIEIDERELYYKEIDLLTSYCSTCLDNHQKEKMVLLMLKLQLLQYATDNNLEEDQVVYYNDILRLLDGDKVDIVKPCVCNDTHCSCINGVCALC